MVKARHPGLQAVLRKLEQRSSLTEDEIQLLRRQISLMEKKESQDRRERSKDINGTIGVTTGEDAFSGHATQAGTQNNLCSFAKQTVEFYRRAQDLLLSSIGIGTYRGAINDETDAAYVAAINAALIGGVNLIDCSLNYRQQRSERAVAVALRRFEKSGGKREGIVVSSKGGYLVKGAFATDTLKVDEVVGGEHSIAPAFLADQISRSRHNLNLETIDIYYLHNPEIQLKYVNHSTFICRIRAAFEELERAVSDNRIRYFGTATWNGYHSNILNLPELVRIARAVAGENHHFRFVQLPINLAMYGAINKSVARRPAVIDHANESDVTVIASASLFNGRLSRDLPPELVSRLPGCRTDSQKAIQFTRSTPGVTSALVGMRNELHVAENLSLALVRPLNGREHARLLS
jgi:aryl-alcohol dehydrogenase-like predicted oxidoreductase